MDQLFRVELGCGNNKNKGYIGIDRIAFPNVDIVADLDQGIPLEDNSVDILLCCHSLEHFSDMKNIMSEIYRVCKHRAIIIILAPYHMETINLANIYHKQVFNEATFRFFTNEDFTTFDKRDYYNPDVLKWALGKSDNSNNNINLCTLDIELFYFPSYRQLTEEEKRNARRSLINVCDQIYYTLAVNKVDTPFTYEDISELRKKAKQEEIPRINAIRNRDLYSLPDNTSIINDIKKWDKDFMEKQDKINNDLYNKIDDLSTCQQNLDNCIKQELIKNNESIIDLVDSCLKKTEEKVLENANSIIELGAKNQEKHKEIEYSYNQKLEFVYKDMSMQVQDLHKLVNKSQITEDMILENVNEIKHIDKKNQEKYNRMDYIYNQKFEMFRKDMSLQVQGVHRTINKFEKTVEVILDNIKEIDEKSNAKYREVEYSYNQKLEMFCKDISSQIIELHEQINRLRLEKNSLASINLELLKNSEEHGIINRYFKLFRRNNDLFYSIRENYLFFTDGMLLKNIYLRSSSIIVASKAIPYYKHIEYKVNGYGSKIHFFLLSNIGANLCVEVVYKDIIIKQEKIEVNFEGIYTCVLNQEIKGEAFIRFITLDNKSIVRVLEIANRKYILFSRRYLAYFVSD